MKKAIALLLVLITTCAFAAAAAQDVEIHREEGQFYMVVTLPNGAQVTGSLTDGPFSITEVEFTDPGRPSIVITAAMDETYVGQNLSSLSKEDVNRIISEITVEMAQPSVETRVTPEGYTYIVANESTSANDTCDTVMLINGYFIMVNVFYKDFSELTPQDQEIGPSIVETFRFVDNTNS